jgi:hypothetical protein
MDAPANNNPGPNERKNEFIFVVIVGFSDYLVIYS